MAAAGGTEMLWAQFLAWAALPASRALIWGTTTRLLGLVYVIALGALAQQVLAIGGSQGISARLVPARPTRRGTTIHSATRAAARPPAPLLAPRRRLPAAEGELTPSRPRSAARDQPVREILRQQKRDFPGTARRLWYFPSVFQLPCCPPTDGALRAVSWLGVLGGVAMAYGGSAGRLVRRARPPLAYHPAPPTRRVHCGSRSAAQCRRVVWRRARRWRGCAC